MPNFGQRTWLCLKNRYWNHVPVVVQPASTWYFWPWPYLMSTRRNRATHLLPRP